MKNWLGNNWFKILAALMLFGALGNHPYSYFQWLRWIVCAAGAYTAYSAHLAKKVSWTWVFAIIALLFNPIAPFYMQKDTWRTIDFIAAVVFLVPLRWKLDIKTNHE